MFQLELKEPKETDSHLKAEARGNVVYVSRMCRLPEQQLRTSHRQRKLVASSVDLSDRIREAKLMILSRIQVEQYIRTVK